MIRPVQRLSHGAFWFKISFLVLISPIFLTTQVIAQVPESIQEIRKHYQYVQEQIEMAKDQENPGGLYCNTIHENVFDHPWRAIGFYNRKVNFWYDDQPGMACDEPEFGGDEACHLQFITENVQNGIGAWHAEYLYKNGVLIFTFVAHEGGEWRFYWEGTELIRAQLDDEILMEISPEVEMDAERYRNEGLKFRQHYLDLF